MRCTRCGDVIGVWEPIVIADASGARRTSLVAEVDEAGERLHLHTECWSTAGPDVSVPSGFGIDHGTFPPQLVWHLRANSAAVRAATASARAERLRLRAKSQRPASELLDAAAERLDRCATAQARTGTRFRELTRASIGVRALASRPKALKALGIE